MRDRDLNPAPKLKNPNRVTANMVSLAALNAGIHLYIPGKNKIWVSFHDITTNAQKAIDLAVAAGMYFSLDGAHNFTKNPKGTRWVCIIGPARGRFARQFMAETPAKAICAALLDHLDHPWTN